MAKNSWYLRAVFVCLHEFVQLPHSIHISCNHIFVYLTPNEFLHAAFVDIAAGEIPHNGAWYIYKRVDVSGFNKANAFL
jgi:hypothetical protein